MRSERERRVAESDDVRESRSVVNVARREAISYVGRMRERKKRAGEMA